MESSQLPPLPTQNEIQFDSNQGKYAYYRFLGAVVNAETRDWLTNFRDKILRGAKNEDMQLSQGAMNIPKAEDEFENTNGFLTSVTTVFRALFKNN